MLCEGGRGLPTTFTSASHHMHSLRRRTIGVSWLTGGPRRRDDSRRRERPAAAQSISAQHQGPARRHLAATVIAALFLLTQAGSAAAQAPRPGTLRLIVEDVTSLRVPDAHVTVTAADGTVTIATSDERGEVVFELSGSGRYAAHIEAAGFEPLDLDGLQVRSGGRTTRTIALKIAGILEEVRVVPAAADRQIADAFTNQLSDEQIAALPTDPDELLLYLQQLAGLDADVLVDGFSGGVLQPGMQIADIRIRWDATAADSSGGPRVEIRTRPGGTRWRTSANASVRDESLNARHAFSSQRPTGTTREYGWTLDGPLVRNRTGLSLSLDGADALDQQAIRPATLAGLRPALISRPTTRLGVNVRLDHSINPAQDLRVEFRQSGSESRNLGIGEFDLPERGYWRDQSEREFKAAHRITISRRHVNDLRARLRWRSSELASLLDDTTVRVLDAFTSGGAQVEGGRRSFDLELQDELEFQIGRRHQMRSGFSINGASFSGNERRNAAGTFTFASLEQFVDGRPMTFTQRVGDPSFDYSLYRFAWFIQDGFRVRPNLMVNVGVRHEFQTHLDDWLNLSPRASLTWTPFGKTTIRASAGINRQWFEASLYEQTIIVNGRRQRELVVVDPGYPEPFVDGTLQDAPPPSITRVAPQLQMPALSRFTIGADRPLGGGARARVSYSRQYGRDLFRSRDTNAPVDGVRADPSVRNVTELESTAGSENQSLDLSLVLNRQAHRFSSSVSYTLGESHNETDTPLSLPPNSYDLSREWGPSRQDIRHRLNATVTTDLWLGFKLWANLRAQSSAPYTVTTGVDANGDGINNERPLAVGRNSEHGAPTATLNATLTWGSGFGRRAPVDTATRPGGAARDAEPVLRVELYAYVTNVLNAVNLQNFSGVMTSPFLGMATSASAARRIVLGTRLFL